MAQKSRALTALPEDVGSVPQRLRAAYNCLLLQIQGYTCIHAGAISIPTKNITKRGSKILAGLQIRNKIQDTMDA